MGVKPAADFEIEYIEADNEHDSSDDETVVQGHLNDRNSRRKRTITGFSTSHLGASNISQNIDHLS